MSITVKLYGELRERIKEIEQEKGLPATLHIEIGDFHSILDILNKLKIDERELSHIFLNGVYTGSGTQIKNGDRIGLFPTNMALIFAEIPDINSIHIKVKILADFKINGKPELHVKIPDGSTLNSIIKKLNLPRQVPSHKFHVNGKRSDDYNSVINANDTIEIHPA